MTTMKRGFAVPSAALPEKNNLKPINRVDLLALYKRPAQAESDTLMLLFKLEQSTCVLYPCRYSPRRVPAQPFLG